MQYNINEWSKKSFIVEDGLVKINYASQPSLLSIVNELRENNHKGPLILRFPHLIKHQIDKLYNSFERSIKEFEYQSSFNAVFPLKVNQFPNFIEPLVKIAKGYNYGLEAGSKAELILAMAKANMGSPITVNGFKDEEMIHMGFIAAAMGHNITMTIEGLNELETIIKVASYTQAPYPKIGIRIRLHSGGIGIWAKSGGMNSKFGLTSTEIVQALKLLKEHNLIDQLSMLHFHIGSQINSISPLKKALREAGNIYAQMIKMGATSLDSINIGGGLAVDYSTGYTPISNYTLQEFTNDVVYLLKEIASSKKVPEPHIFTESGRFIAAYHSVLIAPVLELFSQEYEDSELDLKEVNPPLVDELHELYNSLTSSNAREYLHDSLDHMESLLTLFDLGYITLEDRSNTEILVHLIIKKALFLLRDKNSKELSNIQDRIQEKYLVNFSLFQSLPDFWGLNQNFPIMPIHHLDEKASRLASLWDITCDSDGELEFSSKNPLYLHEINVEKEDYFIGFFLTGAYQETLGMKHNLFAHPTEAVIEIDENGYCIENIIKSQSIVDVIEDLDYNVTQIKSSLFESVANSTLINGEKKDTLKESLELYINENGYLRTMNNA